MKARDATGPNWSAYRSDCGRLKTVSVEPKYYIPWRNLNVGGERISKHFGHWRDNPVNWGVGFSAGYTSRYNPITDKITLRANFTKERYALYVASHEYAHALHHKALGGMWWPGESATDFWNWECFSHHFSKVTNVRCALQEGFAQYAGGIGADGYYDDCFEHFGDPTKRMPLRPVKDTVPWWWDCRKKAYNRTKPKVEGHVAALLHDLTDDESERGDFTEYPGLYVAEIFKTCETRSRYWVGWNPITRKNIYVYKWWARTNVSNIVWCLEEAIDKPTHEDVFWMVSTPVNVKHKAKNKPLDWNSLHIRSTWLKNLKSY